MQKVTLRKATMDDASFIYEMMQDKEYQKYYPTSLVAKNIEEQKKNLLHYTAQMNKEISYYFIILVGKEAAGMLDIYKIDKRNHRSGVGYGISKKYWGKGVATRALKEATKFAKKIGLHALEASAHPKNKASQKVLLKNGFKKIGLIEDYYFEKGKYEDRLLYWKILK